MSVESESLSSPLGNRERLNTQTRSKPRAELRYPCPGVARSGQREGGLLGGCPKQTCLIASLCFQTIGETNHAE